MDSMPSGNSWLQEPSMQGAAGATRPSWLAPPAPPPPALTSWASPETRRRSTRAPKNSVSIPVTMPNLSGLRAPPIPIIEDDQGCSPSGPPANEPDPELAAEIGAHIEELTGGLEAARASVERSRRDLLAHSERDVVQLAVAIAKRVIGRELSLDPELIAGLARDGIKALGAEDSVTCAVSSKTAHALGVLGEWAPNKTRVDVIVDPSLGDGDCQIRGQFGSVDAGVEARLDAIIGLLGIPESGAR